MRQPLRIVYAAGPGDVLTTYRFWSRGEEDPSQVSITYSGQFYDLCRKLGAEAYVISTFKTKGFLRDGPVRVENRPTPFQESSSAALYHLGQVWSSLRLVLSVLRFRARVLVVVCGTGHWFPLRILRLFGVRIIPSMHCVLWPQRRPLSGLPRMIWKLNRRLFTDSAAAILTASKGIGRQLDLVSGRKVDRQYEFLPSYRKEQFSGLPDPSRTREPFRVLFVGRVERNKGVFDLLDVAKRMRTEGRTGFEFDLCGTGSAFDELQAAVRESGLGATFRCHGHCQRAVMREMFARSHVVVVPTTTDFIEGFNQVVAEGVLAGRPVVTSAVCPALEYVRDAVVEVPPDDVRGYGDAILKLREDEAFFDAKVAASRTARGQFYDLSRSWATTLETALADAGIA